MIRKKKASGNRKIKPVTARFLEKVFIELGYVKTSQHGSHVVYNHPGKIFNITIPFHSGKLIQPNLIKNLLRKADVSTDMYLNILESLKK